MKYYIAYGVLAAIASLIITSKTHAEGSLELKPFDMTLNKEIGQ